MYPHKVHLLHSLFRRTLSGFKHIYSSFRQRSTSAPEHPTDVKTAPNVVTKKLTTVELAQTGNVICFQIAEYFCWAYLGFTVAFVIIGQVASVRVLSDIRGSSIGICDYFHEFPVSSLFYRYKYMSVGMVQRFERLS